MSYIFSIATLVSLVIAIVIYRRRPAPIVCGWLSDGLDDNKHSAMICDPQAMCGGRLPSGPIVAVDLFSENPFRSKRGNRCVAAWNATNRRYEFIDIEPSCNGGCQ
jgi:hypothetical protein